MINFILGVLTSLLAVCVFGVFGVFVYSNKGSNKFLTFRIINEEELKDGGIYHLVKRVPYSDNFYFHTAKWDSKINAFSFSRYYDKYKDVIAVLDKNEKPIITEYNPSEINALDIKELSNICFELSDENIESDEIWEKFIDYFDRRGIK